MAIQLPNFQRISFDEANPLLTGMNKGQDLMQQFMMFPQDMRAKILANQIAQVQAQYAQPMAKEALTAAQQQNQFNPRIWESEIGLRGAQANQLGKETQWYDKKTAADIAMEQAQTGLYGAQADQNKIKTNLMNSLFKDQNGGASSMGGIGIGGANASTPSNTVYGIETPKPTREDIINKMLFDTDTFSSKRDNAKDQQQDQYKKFQEELTSSIKEANDAVAMRQALSTFNNAMDKSFYKGSTLGTTPSSGWKSAFIPGDLTPEQEADRAALNLIPKAVSQLRDSMGSARFSNLDMKVAQDLKVDRTMNDETRLFQTQWLNGVNDRIQEKAKFFSVFNNPALGANKATADMLWQEYQSQFPLVSKDGKTFKGSNLGNWPLYTTPKAIQSIKENGTYKPSDAEKNTIMMRLSTGEVVPIKRGRVESAYRKGARPL